VDLRMALGQGLAFVRTAVSDKFAADFRAALSRMFQRFQRKDRGTFTKRKSVAVGVERPASCRRQRLQRIKSGEDELTERIVASSQNAKCTVPAHQFPRSEE